MWLEAQYKRRRGEEQNLLQKELWPCPFLQQNTIQGLIDLDTQPTTFLVMSSNCCHQYSCGPAHTTFYTVISYNNDVNYMGFFPV